MHSTGLDDSPYAEYRAVFEKIRSSYRRDAVVGRVYNYMEVLLAGC